MSTPIQRTLAELQALRLASAHALDRAVSAFEAELQTIAGRMASRARLLIPVLGEGPTAITVEAARLGALRSQLRETLRQSGYDEVVWTHTGDVFDRLARRVAAIPLGADAETFFEAGGASIDALRKLIQIDLLDQGDTVAQQVWRAVMRSAIGGESRPEILDALSEQLGVSFGQAKTLYDTHAGIYSRQVELMAGGEDPNAIYLYLGPDDLATRPFCKKWVGKVLTAAEIDRLDNGQLPNVMLTGGGYNCRHTWTLLSQASELAELAGTGKRAPEWERVTG